MSEKFYSKSKGKKNFCMEGNFYCTNSPYSLLFGIRIFQWEKKSLLFGIC